MLILNLPTLSRDTEKPCMEITKRITFDATYLGFAKQPEVEVNGRQPLQCLKYTEQFHGKIATRIMSPFKISR